MARRLIFGRRKTKAFTAPEEAELWSPKGRKAPALIYVLPHNDFAEAAAKFGYGGRKIGGFAVWGRPFQYDRIYLRADRAASLWLHEWKHLEEGHWHKEK